MKSRAGNFLLAIGGYVLYLFSGVLAALLLFALEFLKDGSTGSLAGFFSGMTEENLSVILLLSYVIVVLFIFSFLKRRHKRIGAYMGLSCVYPFGIFGAIVLGMALNFLTFSVVSPEMSGDTEITALLMACILLGPFVEELVFRGLILRTLGRACGAFWAIIITALLFAISHTEMTQMIYAFVLGVVLGIVRIRSGSLWNAVALHLSFNLSGMVLATSELEISGGAFVMFPVLMILSFVLACSGRKKMRRN